MAAENISVLGDSISTFQGYSPVSGFYYGPAFGDVTGVGRAEDCWWMQVIQASGGELLCNDSWAGSTVSVQGGVMPACSVSRLRRLSKDGVMPDSILIYTGLNDVDRRVPPEAFGADYDQMLRRLRELYPQAQVTCGTLLAGYLGASPFQQFAFFQQRLEPYNQAIRGAVEAHGCRLADMAALGKEYASMDGLHPNGEGMRQLAELWLESVK